MTTIPIEIDLARREDVPAILDIANDAALLTAANFATEPEPLDKWLAAYDETTEQYPWCVARAESAVVAFAKAGPYRPRGAYAWTTETSVYVSPKWQGKGIGKTLYRRLLSVMRAQGYMTVFAGIAKPNPGSEALHVEMGFKGVGTLHQAGWKLGAWHDIGFWELILNEAVEPRTPVPVRHVWNGSPTILPVIDKPNG